MDTPGAQGKSPLVSKTLHLNVWVLLAAKLYPRFGQFIEAHAVDCLLGLAVVNIALRLITKNRLSVEWSPMKKLVVFFAVLTLLLMPTHALAFGRGKRVALDPVTPSTILEGDATGLVEGCGAQPIVGFTYCRIIEGTAADKSITFIGPPAKCGREACVYFKVYNNQGVLVAGPSIPKGQTRVTVPWGKLLACPDSGACVFPLNMRGFWSFTTQVFYIGPDGRERDAVSTGDIVLRVFKTGYTPLNAVEADPAFVWEWSEGGYLYKVTSGLRAYVGKVAP
jgi:hypothetical protein